MKELSQCAHCHAARKQEEANQNKTKKMLQEKKAGHEDAEMRGRSCGCGICEQHTNGRTAGSK
jgi:hypothetical protein